jgi:hypothetical protein
LAAIRFLLGLTVTVALLATGCAPGRASSASQAGPAPCSGIPVPSQDGGDDPDFGRYGFPQVAATRHFTPGQAQQIQFRGLTLTLPADLYTDPLDFELLVSDPAPWQACLGEQFLVLMPYAYRVRNSATGNLLGRFDQPVGFTYTDPRITPQAAYWITTATSPVTVETSSNPWTVEATTLKINNPTARRGWFITVPKA